jgi:hypothetical protein
MKRKKEKDGGGRQTGGKKGKWRRIIEKKFVSIFSFDTLLNPILTCGIKYSPQWTKVNPAVPPPYLSLFLISRSIINYSLGSKLTM